MYEERGAGAVPPGETAPRGRSPPSDASVPHHFTVDVEEYFQVTALEPYIPRCGWETLESRVETGVGHLLDLLARHCQRATFFVLGWVAERHPRLIRDIAEAGHEVASHGWDHRKVTRETPADFRASIRRTKALLEDLTGTPVVGHRAPSFSITPGLEWAIDILIEEGYGYDSSLFPIRRRGYGYPDGPREPYWIWRRSGRLLEVPPTTLRRFGWTLPAAGGAYFRLLPYRLVRAAVAEAASRGVAATFYIHPWEIDADQPRVPALAWWTRLRHYGGLARVGQRLERLLKEFSFTSVREGSLRGRVPRTIRLEDAHATWSVDGNRAGVATVGASAAAGRTGA